MDLFIRFRQIESLYNKLFIMKYKLNESVFVEPYSDNYIVYAPLKKLAFKLEKKSIESIIRFSDGFIEVLNEKGNQLLAFFRKHDLIAGLALENKAMNSDTPDFLPVSLYLLLTSDCNLRCKYCYSNGGETQNDLPLEVAKSAIDIIIENAVKTGITPKVRFHGGGEPTLRWKELTLSTKYFRYQSAKLGTKSIVALNTNGVLSDRKLEWISDNLDNITISLDGIGAIHDMQRPMKNGEGSFSKVLKSMRFLNNKKKKFNVRVTITQNNVSHMKEMVETLSEFGVNGIEFEPLSICGRAYTEDITSPTANQYIEGYKSAKEAAKQRNVNILYSGVRLGIINNKFCGAAGKNFAVSPSGHATFCHRVSDPNDLQSSYFFYGSYSAEKKTFIFDYEKIHFMKNLSCESSPACKDCFVKWNCGGGCYAQNMSENGDFLLEAPSERCSITKGIAAFQLSEKLK